VITTECGDLSPQFYTVQRDSGFSNNRARLHLIVRYRSRYLKNIDSYISDQPFSIFLPWRNPWNNFQVSGNLCIKIIISTAHGTLAWSVSCRYNNPIIIVNALLSREWYFSADLFILANTFKKRCLFFSVTISRGTLGFRGTPVKKHSFRLLRLLTVMKTRRDNAVSCTQLRDLDETINFSFWFPVQKRGYNKSIQNNNGIYCIALLCSLVSCCVERTQIQGVSNKCRKE
jgi:hypothetical protein